jgi:hypothetical protein
MSLGAYDVLQATGQLPEPEWPNLPFKELLRIAFKDRFIGAGRGWASGAVVGTWAGQVWPAGTPGPSSW